MNFLKIAAITLIIGGGLVGSYFIFKNSVPAISSNSKLSEPFEQINNKLPIKNPIKWVEKMISDAKNESLAEVKEGISQNSNQISTNLTEFVASSMFTQMKNLDQSGQNPFDKFNPEDPQSQQMIQDAVSQIQDPNLILGQITIDSRDVKISSDNFSSAKIKYLETTGKIILDNSNEFYTDPIKALEKMTYQANISGINKLVDTYSGIYKDFLDTNVPSDWLTLHERYLVIAKKFEVAYRGIADFKNDPVKSYLLGEMLPGLIEIENQIKKDYSEKEKELGI